MPDIIPIPKVYNKKENNLLLAIYKQLGGNELPPTEGIVNKVENKLVYAILQKVADIITGDGSVKSVQVPEGAEQITVEAGWILEKITIINNTDNAATIGVHLSDTQIVEENEIAANTIQQFVVDIPCINETVFDIINTSEEVRFFIKLSKIS